MSRRQRLPSYRQKGRYAVVTLTDPSGQRKDILLGKYDSPESRKEYARVIAEWETAGRRLRPSAQAGLSVAELLDSFLDFADHHYRHADGTPTKEIIAFKYSFAPVASLYGHTRAADFGPKSLSTVRDEFIRKGYCRRNVNQHVNRIKRAFKWAVSQELIPPTVLVGLQSLRGLQLGRSAARETEPVAPVSTHVVEQTLSHLSGPVAAMVRVQLLTGMRPAEVCAMRGCDIDMTGDIWVYRPVHHKTQWRGLDRFVCLGPQAQSILRRFLKFDSQAHFFSPADAIAEFRAKQRQSRKTPVQPSQRNRRKRRPSRYPGDRYCTESYGKAVAAACDDAFPPPIELRLLAGETKAEWFSRLGKEGVAKVKAWRSAHRWYPNRLRHAHATIVRKTMGLEAAQVALGHAKADVTQIYAERDLELARAVAARLG